MKDLESYGKEIVDYINKYYNEIDIEEYLKKEILCISKENRKHLIDIIEFKFKFGCDKNIGDKIFLNESESSVKFIEILNKIKKL